MIRLKNIDLESEGMKRRSEIYLGDITATISHTIFAAPVKCIVEHIDFYNNNAVPPQTTTASTTNGAMTVRLTTDSDATLQTRGGTATATNTDSISANVRYRLTPSANNSLTFGASIELNWSQIASGVLSSVLCVVTYKPDKRGVL